MGPEGRENYYDEMLAIQARMTYPMEAPLYRDATWQRAETVLDFGAGNCAYTYELAARHPEKHFICLEKNPALAAYAQTRCRLSNVTVRVGTLDELSDHFDFVLARLVLSHVPNRHAIVERLAFLANRSSGLLVIDADDRPLLFDPEMPAFRSLLGSLRQGVDAKGGMRDSWHTAQQEWTPYGFTERVSLRLVPNSHLCDKMDMYRYMYYTAKVFLPSELPAEVKRDFEQWTMAPNPYAQYGIYGVLFGREQA